MPGMALRSRARFPEIPEGRPHYESFYLKAADPAGGRCVWIRHTVLARPGSPLTGALWLTLFDRGGRPVALKQAFSAEQLHADDETYIAIGGSSLTPASASGSLDAGEFGSGRWELRFEGDSPPFEYLPRGWMYERPVPRTKAVSVYPSVEFTGAVEVAGRGLELDGWRGMIGHNWGQEHPHRGIWIHGAGFTQAPDAYLDVVVGRIKIGPVVTPWIANGCLCIDGQRHRLGGLRPGSAAIDESPTGAGFSLRGTDISLEGRVQAPADQFVGWRYGEPAGGWHPTLNCSVADMRLSVRAAGTRGASAPERELSLAAAAAYELQLREQDHGIALQPFSDP